MLDIKSYRKDKDLGRANNDAFRQTTADVLCLRDGDSLFLTPDYGNILDEYHRLNPNAVLICYLNRIHPLAKEQLIHGVPSEDSDIRKWIQLAEIQKGQLYRVTPCTGRLSGTLYVIPRTVWDRVKFREGIGALGVDTYFFDDVRKAGIEVLRMDGLLIWHTYRLATNIHDKSHLK